LGKNAGVVTTSPDSNCRKNLPPEGELSKKKGDKEHHGGGEEGMAKGRRN